MHETILLNLQSNLDKIVHKLKKLYAYGTDHPTVANTDKGHHKLNLFIMDTSVIRQIFVVSCRKHLSFCSKLMVCTIQTVHN